MGDSGGRMSPPKKSSIDDIINHITKDLNSYDGQYIVLGQPSPSQAPPSHLWQSTSSEMNPIQQPGMYKPPPQPQQHSMYYNPAPGHMSYGNMPHYQNSYMQQYQHPPPLQPPLMRDYGLFANHNDQMMPTHNNTYPNHQLIDNLVGNWVPNQSGTYSPFGNPSPVPLNVEKEERERERERPVFSDMPRQESLLSAGTRKPRIVAEVRPMRPSYSAVLTKSPPIPAQSSKSSGKLIPPIGAKGEGAKSKSGKGKKAEPDSKTAPGGTLKRQHSSGGEDSKSTGGSQHATKTNNPLSQWSSLEGNGTNVANGGEDYLDMDEGKFSRKEAGRRSKRNKNKYHGLNEEEEEEEDENEEEEEDDDDEEGEKGGAEGVGASKQSSGKRGPSSAAGNVQWGVRETESSVHHRATDKKMRAEEGKKGKGGEVGGGKGGRKKEAAGGGGGGAGKKSTRAAKRRDGHAQMIGVMVRQWQAECSRLAVLFAAWFFNLVWDIVAMSSGLMVYLFGLLMECVRFWGVSVRLKAAALLHRKWWPYSLPWWRKKRPKLARNISLPGTGDEAIRRLLSCKEKDPYSILGVAPDCSDDDIKKYYRRQAILVHPDKNQQAGAEEAFKTLAHAFDLIGEPETRLAYDRRVTESTQAEQAWSELNELLSKLSQKVEIATNTIRCTHCGGRHRRVLMDRPSYAARFCAQCKIHHSAREGDIWAESWGLGLLWHYYACMETSVYDITEWAACQAVNLKHLKANSHSVQYRIVVGKQHPPPASPAHHSHHPHCPNGSSDPDIEDFLNTLYQSSSGGGSTLCSEHSLHQHSHLHHSHSRSRRKGGKKKK